MSSVEAATADDGTGPATGGGGRWGRVVAEPGHREPDGPVAISDNSADDTDQNCPPEPVGGVRAGEKAGLWTRLKQRWRKHGVVEIDESHHRFGVLSCIKEAIKDVVVNHPELGPKDAIVPDDFRHVLERTVTGPNGETFQFKSYASGVFATLRRAIGLSEDSYVRSLSPPGLPYMEFISNSKSGRDFFLTNDKAYFLKTEKKYYVKVFLDLLDDYLNHFLKYPHSLIVKYLGLYSIKVPGESMMYFYVMQSIFHPDERIELRYDIKGCTAGRYQPPPAPGSQALTVLKDQNFLDETIYLGPQRDWFLQQLRHDVNLLQGLGVQDYSLLVGYHPLHEDEKIHDLGDLMIRVKKSVAATRRPAEQRGDIETNVDDVDSVPSSPVKVTVRGADDGGGWEAKSPSDIEMKDIKTFPTVGFRKLLSSTEEADEDKDLLNFKPDKNILQDVNERLKLQMSFLDSKYLDEVGAENRRLLPNSKNALHTIDGPETRYFLGIIDFFTLYECRQRTGRVLKSIKFCCGDHSTIPPQPYGERLYDYVVGHSR